MSGLPFFINILWVLLPAAMWIALGIYAWIEHRADRMREEAEEATFETETLEAHGKEVEDE